MLPDVSRHNTVSMREKVNKGGVLPKGGRRELCQVLPDMFPDIWVQFDTMSSRLPNSL